ncbi:TetR/AcrR family transcriptional regulator [Rhodococcus sp. H29-C3]|uniref:TetR/AcrR family transcriptional regulator n=1 Tax=Rhodococcus sp. H29-C3 TaxID=3046307 RepID=UPI0024BA6419|nr:TetR/AcrR family transcriptional regulator [Rhodococcus sp. H29-C3]MDJ0363069.1 TetR/AcrR family transcriptional regulator [Rhodococcus sp. H29-C3]
MPRSASTTESGERDAASHPPRRYPTRPDTTASRNAIIAAATENFQNRGYHGTSIRDIARDADMTAASIYHHFPSKQHILQYLMESALKTVISRTQSALINAGKSPVEQLEAVVRAWVQFHACNTAEALISSTEIRSLDAVGHRLVISLRDQQQQLFRDIIHRGVTDGVFTTVYPVEASRAIINMGVAISSWYRPNGSLTPDDIAERYVSIALGAVGVRAEV